MKKVLVSLFGICFLLMTSSIASAALTTIGTATYKCDGQFLGIPNEHRHPDSRREERHKLRDSRSWWTSFSGSSAWSNMVAWNRVGRFDNH
jgi:hypothetical protein